jgi:hypothetical protein
MYITVPLKVHIVKNVDYTLEFTGYRRQDSEIFFIPGKDGGQIEGWFGSFPGKGMRTCVG